MAQMAQIPNSAEQCEHEGICVNQLSPRELTLQRTWRDRRHSHRIQLANISNLLNNDARHSYPPQGYCRILMALNSTSANNRIDHL